jgi:hypothetical protein
MMLGYSTYKDVRTREIHDIVWISFGFIGLILNIYDFSTGNLVFTEIIFPVIFMGVLGLLLNYFSLFGEADILALITVVFIQPQPPLFLVQSQGWKPPFFAFTILSNTALIGLISAFMMFFKNMLLLIKGEDLFERHPEIGKLKKIILFISGSNMTLEEIKGPPFHYPLEFPESTEKIKLKPDFNDDNYAFEVFNKLKKTGLRRVWVSATLPYIAVIFLGYIVSISFGDLFLMFFLLIL